MAIMEIEGENEDPFKIRDLWRPSKFGLQPLPQLEPLTWDKELSGSSFLQLVE